VDEQVYASKVEKEIKKLISAGFLLEEERAQLIKAAIKEYQVAITIKK